MNKERILFKKNSNHFLPNVINKFLVFLHFVVPTAQTFWFNIIVILVSDSLKALALLNLKCEILNSSHVGILSRLYIWLLMIHTDL